MFGTLTPHADARRGDESRMKPAVVCPLKYESRFARRSLGDLADVLCHGPYREGMERVFDSGGLEARPLVILLGVSGGLRETALCPPIARVVDESGNEWPVPIPDAPSNGATVAGVDRILTDEPSKRALGESAGADLVDMESHVFAERATADGLRWTVVRGVSDGPDDAFPAWIAELLDPMGGVRAGAVASRLALHPSSAATLRRIGRRGSRAMRAACARARTIIEGDDA